MMMLSIRIGSSLFFPFFFSLADALSFDRFSLLCVFLIFLIDLKENESHIE